jgi:hypothetical protein
MYVGKLVFAQIMEHLPLHTFRRIVARYAGERKVKSFSCLDQFLCMAFAQLTFRESLRDIEACLRAQRSKLYHLGIRSTVARNTLANANAVRDWRIYADFAQGLIATARRLYVDEPFGVDLKESVYALDTTTIDLCLSVFSWAPFRLTKAAVKLHTLLDLRGNIPTFIHISDGKMHEVNILDQLLPEPGAFYVMDRGFLDFERLYRFHEAGSFFVTRGKSNLKAQRRYSRPVDRATGLICDQTVVLTGFYSHKALVDRKYRLLFTSAFRRRKPGPKGPSPSRIAAIVEMKRRNPKFGCVRIAQQISYVFGVDLDKDVVRRVLAKHDRTSPSADGPSWLSFIAQSKDSLWSVDASGCEAVLLTGPWVMVGMELFPPPLGRFRRGSYTR